MNVLIPLVTATLAVAAVVVPAGFAAAQSARPPRDPANIQRKVQKSAELQRQALQTLSEPAKAAKLVGGAYTELKSAHDDIVMNVSNSRRLDPTLGLSSRKAEQALALVQVAGDTLNGHAQWSDPDGAVAGVRDRLQQALRLTNSLLATGF